MCVCVCLLLLICLFLSVLSAFHANKHTHNKTSNTSTCFTAKPSITVTGAINAKMSTRIFLPITCWSIMPMPCFQMHVIHLWYCQLPKYSNTWCIFRKYVVTVVYYAIPISELKSRWMTATQGSLSTGDYASSVCRVTPIKGQLFWIPGQNPTRKYLTYWWSEAVYIMVNML